MSRIEELEQTREKINEELRFLRNKDSNCDKASAPTNQGAMAAMAGREKSAEEIIADLFTYHAPDQQAAQSYETIRDAAKHRMTQERKTQGPH